MIKFLRILLLPVSILYGLIILVRNLLFDFNILPSERFNLPIISVGNLVVGGTGKTPMTECLIRLLKQDYKVATLSRGYGRKTKGFIVASTNVKSILIGDEPKQYKNKFPEIIVSVCEKRAEGIRTLMQNYHPEIILLDDAFQHRAVVPGLSILLMEYDSIDKMDFMLPSGNLREMKSGKKRADIIIVTKCPTELSLSEREKIRNSLHPKEHQKVYFSFIDYNNFYRYINNEIDSSPSLLEMDVSEYSILILSGIGNPQSFANHLKKYVKEVVICFYMDHHYFIEKDIKDVGNKFNSISNPKKLVFTTEKDLMRLMDLPQELLAAITPIYYVPITTKFFEEDEKNFNEQILEYVRNSKANS